MSLKYYGIYLAYAPTVDLRHEGLGRYLAAFLKGAADRKDIRFVLVSPSWSKKGLEDLFASERVPQECFELYSPAATPLILRGYQAYIKYKSRSRKTKGYLHAIRQWTRAKIGNLTDHTVSRLAQVRSIFSLLLLLLDLGFWLGLIALILSPLVAFVVIIKKFAQIANRKKIRFFATSSNIAIRLRGILKEPKENDFIFRFYKKIEEDESKHMLNVVNKLQHVCAWYSPTAFWPAFNNIQAPKLICVPDVVLTDFPVGFCGIGGERFLSVFEAVETTIQSTQNFVTYSNAVKWETLVDRYAVRATNIAVIHHAPNDLSRWVTISGFDDVNATSRHYCEWLLSSALRKSFNPAYSFDFANGSVKYLFYASQFRPNKNLLSLLKAYEYLLRKRFIGHKLILTGNPHALPVVQKFIADHRLENDVLCLHGLKIQELAACYKLADLAVNPSLSEGGCPFTFTEALSVDTPVVMARISVTEEVLTDPELQDITFFDPYDWKDIAERIEWALNHRDHLLSVQRKTYAKLAQRSWTDVVNEHIQVLERIADNSDQLHALKAA